MNTTEPHVHAVPKEAEAAAAAAVAPHIAGIKVVILALMKTAGDAGLIASEVPGLINTVRRRFVDLQKDGLIKPNGQTRANERGMKETVYVLGRDPLAAVRRAKPYETTISGFEGLGGPAELGPKQTIRVTVDIPREIWETIPSPARVRFL